MPVSAWIIHLFFNIYLVSTKWARFKFVIHIFASYSYPYIAFLIKLVPASLVFTNTSFHCSFKLFLYIGCAFSSYLMCISAALYLTASLFSGNSSINISSNAFTSFSICSYHSPKPSNSCCI